MKNVTPFKQSITLLLIICCAACSARQPQGWQLDRMPAALETEYALSALPPHLREHATVYLLDPEKGYYLARQGNNGFSAFVNRTEWEWERFEQNTYAAMAYDSTISKLFLPVFFDAAAMRATGRYTAEQVRDTVVQRVKNGIYKVPAKTGISYMLSPMMRTRDGNNIVNRVMPHYMFYAPCMADSDIGGGWVPGGHQPFVINSGTTLDKAHSIFNFIILAEGEQEKAKIIEGNKSLLQKLAGYRPFLKIEAGDMNMEHH
jgi:hypothetical protein